MFKQKNSNENKSQREILEGKYKGAVTSILTIIGCTVVNIVFILMGVDTYFVVSAFIPFYLFGMGVSDDNGYIFGFEYFQYMNDEDVIFFVIMTILTVLITLAYFACWFFAKKNKCAPLIVGTVLYCVDTVLLLVLVPDSSMVIDIVIHGTVIYSLISGITAFKKLKNLPPEMQMPYMDATSNQDENAQRSYQQPYSPAQSETIVYVNTRIADKYVLFRQVNNRYELAIDGVVHDSYDQLNVPFILSSYIGNNKIDAVYDGKSNYYIYVDGNKFAESSENSFSEYSV